MKLDFLGATEEVTGSKFLLTSQKGVKILLDCGMYQGKGLETDHMNRDLGFDPKEVDFILLSHAHIDHSGLIPYIYKLGFRGKIFCTPATRDLCAIMLADSGRIQEADAKQFNKKKERIDKEPIEPIYTEKDAAECMTQFISIPRELKFNITPDISIEFFETGHMLGSGAIHITFKEGRKTRTLCYTGDIGRYDKRILPDPVPFPFADYIITESTYGDRLHSTLDDADKQLMLIVRDACAKRLGKLLIPSFAIGRTQEIVYALHRLNKAGDLPDIEIFVDSPLACSATNIYRLHDENFNADLRQFMENTKDPFGFDNLTYVRSVDDSKRLNEFNRPCIIISASGMMEAGRIKHHLANNIENPKTTILCVGYCSPNTLGAKIMRGDPVVSIFGEDHQVRAHLERIDAYSGHADYQELIRYLSCQKGNRRLKKIFIVHGEEGVRQAYAKHLAEAGFKKTQVPRFRESVELS
ncbi:MAG: MBL fold metallo-hydrolase [Bacteroidales bacterium]|nr:MBL fold metallo-hydrolase [Bacteroidales bacterium]MCR4858080.1 MBL fold metallo-hydrolase [Bacteroidales bacterium]